MIWSGFLICVSFFMLMTLWCSSIQMNLKKFPPARNASLSLKSLKRYALYLWPPCLSCSPIVCGFAFSISFFFLKKKNCWGGEGGLLDFQCVVISWGGLLNQMEHSISGAGLVVYRWRRCFGWWISTASRFVESYRWPYFFQVFNYHSSTQNCIRLSCYRAALIHNYMM